MTRPRIGVLALQGDVVEHEKALHRGGAEPVRVRRVGELESVTALVLPGGESTTIGKLLAVCELLEPLRRSIAAGLPVFGSCAGMILLADKVLDGAPDQVMLGGMDIAVRRNAFGRQVESFERELDVAGLGAPPVTGVFIRAPWVESVGPTVEVLASVDGHPVAVRQGSMLATSFHPEMTDDNRLHALFVSMATLPRTRRTATTGETHA